METRNWSKVSWGVLFSVLVLGCASVPYREAMEVGPVSPGPAESIVLDQIMILADVSGSMQSKKEFSLEKSLVLSFIAAMPDGKYDSGLRSFGGEAKSRWLVVPLSRFDRNVMTAGAAQLKFLAGSTPMDLAFQSMQPELERRRGKAALVIFSDGKPRSTNAALAACQALKWAYRGDLCIHTVQMGSSPGGASFLQRLADLSDCGSFRTAAEIDNPATLELFVREVFFSKAKDSDGDGVPDDRDECPDTPKGVKVDKVGCPLDSDGDGVPDYKDECPDTPKDVKVDKVGCPLDSDGDGVPDYKDECPGTPKGVKVDERGCWVLRGLNFDYDKFEVKPEFYGRLDEVVKILQENPDLKIGVEGHTDSKGSAAYNQKLSENRAMAVRDYLVKAGIAEGRLVVKGFGESRPVKPNDTPENMYLNRRVELSVIE